MPSAASNVLLALQQSGLVRSTADPFISIEQTLQVVLDVESAGLDIYAGVLVATDVPEIKVLSKEFVEEEAEHVAELKRWIQLHLSGARLPTAI